MTVALQSLRDQGWPPKLQPGVQVPAAILRLSSCLCLASSRLGSWEPLHAGSVLWGVLRKSPGKFPDHVRATLVAITASHFLARQPLSASFKIRIGRLSGLQCDIFVRTSLLPRIAGRLSEKRRNHGRGMKTRLSRLHMTALFDCAGLSALFRSDAVGTCHRNYAVDSASQSLRSTTLDALRGCYRNTLLVCFPFMCNWHL